MIYYEGSVLKSVKKGQISKNLFKIFNDVFITIDTIKI